MNWKVLVRSLCDPPEAGGYGHNLDALANMTLWQLSLFCADKKTLGVSGGSVSSFREAKALLKERKKRGNKAR